jgi:hypothetical protein
MTIAPGRQQIADIVSRVFLELGATLEDAEDLNETILIHDGRYYARSYRSDELMAMWFVENGFIQFYDAEGAMLRTVNLLQELPANRRAA